MTTLSSVKTLAESPNLKSIPPNYAFFTNSNDQLDPVSSSKDDEESIPVIDFSQLSSCDHEQRSNAVHLLGKACQEWGFFMLVNHGVEERMMKAMIDACRGFFDLTEEEKREYEGKDVLDPIRCGTSVNTSVENVFFWRDFLKIAVHPKFHSPNKPPGFSEVMEEYTREIRKLSLELLKGISESLGLEPCYAEKALNMESCFQRLTANLYPPCPEPDLAIGMPPHSDHGLLTVLIQNGIGGLQLYHNGKWVNANAIANALLINIGDHIEVMSNGKYKSVLHRAIVNSKNTRISIIIVNGPSPDAVVAPAPQLIDNKSNPAAYIGMKFIDYLELHQSNRLDGKSALDRVRINSKN
jgi:isopenicillin N synthase-like dioxygenase